MTTPISLAAGDHGRRLRHAAVAAVARRLPQAVSRALGQHQPAAAGGQPACRPWPAPTSAWPRRSSSATRSIASWCWTSCAKCAPTPSAVLLEPMGRNTAPAVTLAALQALEAGADPVLVVTPVRPDRDRRGRLHAGPAGRSAARRGRRDRDPRHPPDRPETGYGYIRADGDGSGRAASSRNPTPPPPTRYLADGRYFWNAGIFVLRASVWLAALERFRPDIAQATRAAWAARSDRRHASCGPARPRLPPCRRSRSTTR